MRRGVIGSLRGEALSATVLFIPTRPFRGRVFFYQSAGFANCLTGSGSWQPV